MSDFLRTIAQIKRAEVAALNKKRAALSGRSQPPRSLYRALGADSVDKKDKQRLLGLIAEIKKASPSQGEIRPDLNVTSLAKTYQDAGAQALSVLTEKEYFKGSTDDLIRAREAVSLPILRKDFIIDPLQILESASINADAVLLIAALLSNTQLDELYHAALESELEPLVEIHSLQELERTLKLPLKIIGINNRNLATLDVDTNLVATIMPYVPQQISVIAESGIKTKAEARALRSIGVCALLVGEALVKAADPKTLIREFRCADTH